MVHAVGSGVCGIFVTEGNEGFGILIAGSKADQEGLGPVATIPRVTGSHAMGKSSLLGYPEFPDPLTAASTRQLLTPRPDERRRVRPQILAPASCLGRLRRPKTFPMPVIWPPLAST